jgi:phage nucleotide-binding protein
LRYVDGLDTIPNTDADNALILGTALHTGIEEGVEQALDFYKNSFPVLTDDHIHEMMKLEAMIPKAKAMLPPGGTFELPIGNADFIGFMDYLVPVDEDLSDKTEICDACPKGDCGSAYTGSCPCGKFTARSKDTFDLYDFKYSNNAKNYAVSGQLHEYKYWYELTHPGHRIRNMYFLIVPKPKIRQKSTETLSQFRDRLQAALKDAEPTLMPIQYNPMKIVDFLTDVKHMVEATDFPKNPNHFCGWCEYEEYCQKGWDYMLLPKNERRDLNATKKKVVWLYGAPFSGKTFFANQFPDPLMLNTDGNIKFVDAPYIAIRDTVTVEGRITKRKLAYEVFMDAVAELEKKQNDFRTIVVDLLEDVYESCRVYICDRQGWKHESDDSFRAWDMVRSEFLNTLKRLVNLDYENIILISHEDRSRDLTRKGGDKISSIKPNLQDKVANKVAGMVDLVARIVADDNERVLSFKTSEVIFGGGRLTVHNKEIPLTYDAFCEVYEEANQKAAGAVKRGGNTPATPAPETTDTATGDTPPWNNLPKCPDGDRIFKQHDQNPEIPLCPSIDAGHRCHKEGGPDGCPLWDRPKAPAEEAAPKTDANPPRRTRKKREE